MSWINWLKIEAEGLQGVPQADEELRYIMQWIVCTFVVRAACLYVVLFVVTSLSGKQAERVRQGIWF